MIGFDPCKQDSDNPCVVTVTTKSGNLMSFDEVVARYMSRPATPLHEYHKMVVEAAKYYGAAIIKEQEAVVVVTEDAEVVSVETVPREQNLLLE